MLVIERTTSDLSAQADDTPPHRETERKEERRVIAAR